MRSTKYSLTTAKLSLVSEYSNWLLDDNYQLNYTCESFRKYRYKADLTVSCLSVCDIRFATPVSQKIRLND